MQRDATKFIPSMNFRTSLKQSSMLNLERLPAKSESEISNKVSHTLTRRNASALIWFIAYLWNNLFYWRLVTAVQSVRYKPSRSQNLWTYRHSLLWRILLSQWLYPYDMTLDKLTRCDCITILLARYSHILYFTKILLRTACTLKMASPHLEWLQPFSFTATA